VSRPSEGGLITAHTADAVFDELFLTAEGRAETVCAATVTATTHMITYAISPERLRALVAGNAVARDWMLAEIGPASSQRAMKCPKCQTENPADSVFCEECAAPLEAACPTCGAAGHAGRHGPELGASSLPA
jgi:double zinc ribbon protein